MIFCMGSRSSKNIGIQFTTIDLSQIATTLDALEAGYDDANMGTDSTNMDDTGLSQLLDSSPYNQSLLRLLMQDA